jgi:hypothetical protein
MHNFRAFSISRWGFSLLDTVPAVTFHSRARGNGAVMLFMHNKCAREWRFAPISISFDHG